MHFAHKFELHCIDDDLNHKLLGKINPNNRTKIATTVWQNHQSTA